MGASLFVVESVEGYAECQPFRDEVSFEPRFKGESHVWNLRCLFATRRAVAQRGVRAERRPAVWCRMLA